jgi:exopolysaccharide production protein ExoZ
LAFHLTLRYDLDLTVGASGVDLFFVISGFVMWVTTADGAITPREFMLKRLIRIVPNYWIATIATALLIFVKPNFTYGHTLDSYRLLGSLVFFPTLVSDRILPIVLQGWTLIYEMIFYVFFAVSLFIRRAYRPHVIAAMLFAALAFQVAEVEPHIRSVTKPILLEFLAGVWLGLLWERVRISPGYSVLLFLAGTLGLFLSEYLKPELPQVFEFGVPSALLVAGAAFYERSCPVRDIPVLRFLGDASYSIYIWHVFFATIILGLLLRTGVAAPLQLILELTGTVAACCLTYVWVEYPITRRLRALIATGPLHRTRAQSS